MKRHKGKFTREIIWLERYRNWHAVSIGVLLHKAACIALFATRQRRQRHCAWWRSTGWSACGNQWKHGTRDMKHMHQVYIRRSIWLWLKKSQQNRWWPNLKSVKTKQSLVLCTKVFIANSVCIGVGVECAELQRVKHCYAVWSIELFIATSIQFCWRSQCH